MWVRFTSVFKWSPTEAWSQTYQPGVAINVTKACADAAIAAGQAEKAPPEKKHGKD